MAFVRILHLTVVLPRYTLKWDKRRELGSTPDMVVQRKWKYWVIHNISAECNLIMIIQYIVKR